MSRLVHPTHLATWIFESGFPWGLWLPYLSGAFVLAVGLITTRNELLRKEGLNKVVALGPIFLAVPFAVFGTEHFTATKIVAGMVPAWIPGHMFWARLVGICLIAAALSIVARKFTWAASALAGMMILLFVLLIHLPGIAGDPRSRILWVVGLRDLMFSGGAFALAANQKQWGPSVRENLLTVARLFIAVPIGFLGVQQVLHPELAPGVPLDQLTPAWFPAHSLWGYLTGTVFILASFSLITNRRARMAATCLGLLILLLVLLIYLPVVVLNPTAIGSALNSFADVLLLCGSILLLAQALNTDPA